MRERGHPWQQQSISRVESGARALSINEAIDLADILGVSLERLVRDEG